MTTPSWPPTPNHELDYEPPPTPERDPYLLDAPAHRNGVALLAALLEDDGELEDACALSALDALSARRQADAALLDQLLALPAIP